MAWQVFSISMNIGLLAAVAAMVFWGFGDFFIQKTVKKVGDVESLFFIGLFGAVVLFPFVINDLQLIFSSSNILTAIFFLGAITLAVSLINFQALKEGKLSIVDPLLEFELPVTIILGLLLLNETITANQLALSLMIFVGIALISIEKLSLISHKTLLEKGVALALITAVGMAFVNFYTTVVARAATPLLAIWTAWIIFGTACGAYLLFKKGIAGVFVDFKQNKKIILAEGFFDTIAWAFFAIALTNMPLSLATAISEGYPAIAVALGIFLNKEKINLHQRTGIMMTLVSAFGLGMTIL